MKLAGILLLGWALWAAAQHRPADSMQRKLDHIQQNAAKPHPDQTPTVLTEDEVNDYFAAGRVKLPQGVKRVTLTGQPGVITGVAVVDFDDVRAGQHSSNPLLGIFSGTHDVRVQSDAAGAGGDAKIHVRSVSLDGTEIPRFVLELFVNKFLKPKYPNVGLDSQFQMPAKLDIAIVGEHKLTLTQK